MNGIIKISLGGEERILRFNQYANIELYKLLFDNAYATPDMEELLIKSNEMILKNHMLFYKALIYSGIVGNDFVSSFKESVSLEEVGGWVGDMSPNELQDFFLSVWNTFFEAMGVNLEKIKELEEADSNSTEVKKKQRIKKSTQS